MGLKAHPSVCLREAQLNNIPIVRSAAALTKRGVEASKPGALLTKQGPEATKQEALLTKRDLEASKQEALLTKQDLEATKQEALLTHGASLLTHGGPLVSKEGLGAEFFDMGKKQAMTLCWVTERSCVSHR